MLILVVQQWDTLLVDWLHGTNVTKTSFLSVISFKLPGVTKCCIEYLVIAKVVKHCKNKKKCGQSS